MSKYLHREDAPFGPALWQKIDDTVVSAAAAQLSARRILKVEGPYGLGVKVLPLEDGPANEDASVTIPKVMPLAMLKTEFTLMVRDVAAFEEQNTPLPLNTIAQAAIELAQKEDDFLFNGVKAMRMGGLLDWASKNSIKRSDWAKIGSAVGDVIKAVTALDEAGLHGPYALAVPPAWYNMLFRRYEQGFGTELDHLRQIITDGIVKAPALKDGAVVIATGPQFATIVLGQDMMTTFVGPEPGSYKFIISETLALILRQPKALCLIGK